MEKIRSEFLTNPRDNQEAEQIQKAWKDLLEHSFGQDEQPQYVVCEQIVPGVVKRIHNGDIYIEFMPPRDSDPRVIAAHDLKPGTQLKEGDRVEAKIVLSLGWGPETLGAARTLTPEELKLELAAYKKKSRRST